MDTTHACIHGTGFRWAGDGSMVVEAMISHSHSIEWTYEHTHTHTKIRYCSRALRAHALQNRAVKTLISLAMPSPYYASQHILAT